MMRLYSLARSRTPEPLYAREWAVCVLLLREVLDFASVFALALAEVKVVSAAAVVPVPALEMFILSLWW